MICDREFSLLRRRHHCRSCGSLLCDECCSAYLPLPLMGLREPVRVCTQCVRRYYEDKRGQIREANPLEKRFDAIRSRLSHVGE